ncbi:uncharacterized protein Tco025E_04283 [Trypanosoma conorhini]|uniref:Uncharacterized protein n=1 Tax=Trypanosoma conorhini TaxID=83891 RepID=A0A3R7NIT2_9TRYP|nr:uncharacterized protein Tco025E_04283 [Trypanosoma conorhini]RNF19093.1 hypothetical protein Tco025E_04283 [Trypanosoma conorhini]
MPRSFHSAARTVQGGAAAGMTASPPSTAGSYFDLLANSDPRVAFDVLHLGVLAAVAEDEEERPPHSPVPRATASAKAVVVGEGADARFVIPTHQPALDARLPQPQDIAAVDAFLSSTSPSALQDALGPAVLHVVQKYRPQVLREPQQRRRRRPQEEEGEGEREPPAPHGTAAAEGERSDGATS